MPSKTTSQSDGPASRANGGSSFVNDYLADWDDEDPFRSPSPEAASKQDEKKKDVLGIEKELDLKKKPRAPRVKLDETRLLSDKGIPKLRKMAPRLKLKGKGHEFSDAARLLSFYQEWLDDLFPKATFLDALAMVEKAGHKTSMRSARMQWIDEGKPKSSFAAEEEEEDVTIYQRDSATGERESGRVAPVFEQAAQAARERAGTPGGGGGVDDLFGGEDIYNATPRKGDKGGGDAANVADDVPEGDDLDALMADANMDSTRSSAARRALDSLFGRGRGSGNAAARPADEPDEDDLDALMAEAEAEAEARPPATKGSIFGDGTAKQQTKTTQSIAVDDGDDLDALMAEAEADIASGPPKAAQDPPSAAAQQGAGTGFEDDEEAMAEMDGLW